MNEQTPTTPMIFGGEFGVVIWNMETRPVRNYLVLTRGHRMQLQSNHHHSLTRIRYLFLLHPFSSAHFSFTKLSSTHPNQFLKQPGSPLPTNATGHYELHPNEHRSQRKLFGSHTHVFISPHERDKLLQAFLWSQKHEKS